MVLSMQRMVEVATMVLTLLKSECGISRILLQRKQIPQKDMVMRMHTIFDILNSKHCSFALRMTRWTVQTPDRSFGTKSKVMPYHLFNNMSHSMSGVDNFFG